jgi:hypothetical protein
MAVNSKIRLYLLMAGEVAHLNRARHEGHHLGMLEKFPVISI